MLSCKRNFDFSCFPTSHFWNSKLKLITWQRYILNGFSFICVYSSFLGVMSGHLSNLRDCSYVGSIKCAPFPILHLSNAIIGEEFTTIWIGPRLYTKLCTLMTIWNLNLILIYIAFIKLYIWIIHGYSLPSLK